MKLCTYNNTVSLTGAVYFKLATLLLSPTLIELLLNAKWRFYFLYFFLYTLPFRYGIILISIVFLASSCASTPARLSSRIRPKCGPDVSPSELVRESPTRIPYTARASGSDGWQRAIR
jgi:hypothetical protein